MVDNYGNQPYQNYGQNYGYPQDNQGYQQDSQGYYSDASYQDGYYNQAKQMDHFGQDDNNWYQSYANGEYDKPLPEGAEAQGKDKEDPSDFQFNDPGDGNTQPQGNQTLAMPDPQNQKPIKRNMTTVDDEIKDLMTDDGEKKRSNSGGKKQDLGIKESKSEEIKRPKAEPMIIEGGDGPAGELTQSMVLEMNDINCNDGQMRVEIISNENKGMGLKKHTEYLIKGQDSLGEINCFRRYSEFLVFREFLYNRYPGLFIPPVPTKQAQGKLTPEFVEERQYYLNEFLVKLCEFPYLCKTPEVQVFFRPKGKVEDSFKNLQKTSTDFVLKWYMINIKISDMNLPDSKVQQYNTEIAEYVKEQKVLMDHLKAFKQHIKQIVPMKEVEMKYYKQFVQFLNHYEEANEKSVGQGEKPLKLIATDNQASLQVKLDALATEMLNPFVHVRNWIRCEMMNLSALMDAISQMESCDTRKSQCVKRLNDDQQTLEKLQNGKFTFKTMFKKNNKQDMIHEITMKIQQRKKDIENWETIKRFLSIYLYERAIPHFKKKKNNKYINAMQSFTLDELKNSKASQNCWDEFFALTQQVRGDGQ